MCAGVLAALAAGLSGVQSATPEFAWIDDAPGVVRLQERGRDVLTFQLATKSLDGKYPRANYVHPLYDSEGDIVTEDFPKDHLHHRGVFWAWHQVLLNGRPVCDPWVCKDIEWSDPSVKFSANHRSDHGRSAALSVTRDWMIDNPKGESRKQALVRESVRLDVRLSTGATRIIDFDLGFRALVEGVSIGGSDDVKGYGGFSPRVRLADDVTFVGQKGEVKARNTAVDGGAWMNVVRTLDGKKKGVAILVHPSHPGFPLKWLLRARRSMQNPQWPGREPVALSMGKETRLKYRLILHAGDLDSAKLETLWREYASGN